MVDGIARAQKKRHSVATKAGLKKAKKSKKETSKRLLADRALDKAGVVARRFFPASPKRDPPTPPRAEAEAAGARVLVTLRVGAS